MVDNWASTAIDLAYVVRLNAVINGCGSSFKSAGYIKLLLCVILGYWHLVIGETTSYINLQG